MKRVFLVFVSIALTVLFVFPSAAQQYISLGVPTSLKLIEGYEGHRAAQLAVDEINAKGGVKVGQEKDSLKLRPWISGMASQVFRPQKHCSESKN